MTSRGLATSSVSRLKALQEKHSILAARLREEEGRPSAADFYLRQLKKQKLFLKDQIEGMMTGGSAA